MPVTNERFDLGAAVPAWGDLGVVHLVAIGGAGMSAVARLLLQRGVTVSGSDAADSPVLDALRAAGATVWVGHDPAHLDGVDTVVVSSAIREDNPELAAARARGLRVLHRSQALAAVTAGTRVVAVAGANGKTTTTSMLTAALVHAGADPSYASGGEIAQLGTNAAVGAGDAFVVEADESDGSFVVYRPEVAVVTSVQPDHLDFYGTAEAVTEAYGVFAGTVRDGGLLLTCHDDPGALALALAHRGQGHRVLTYGEHADADVRVLSVAADGLGTTSLVRHAGRELTLALSVPGLHNVLDAVAALTAAVDGLGADADAVVEGLAGFTGARRRFEVRGEVGGVTVVDDYAHNPAKVAAVVGTAAGVVARAGRGRVLVVFQPHLYSRTRDFAREFAQALAPADHVVLLDVYGAREAPLPGVTSALIGDPLVDLPGVRRVDVGVGPERAVALLAAAAGPGDLVLTVGAGDVTRLGDPLLAALRAGTEEQA
ncbi:UDP-N-acetylmuramate--L-alanine ligase [Arthrobacter sp. NEB 688]|uniref:UDP-N-acetylmuramate--L-alanine ligase n=1 Tax=Arthrobacter sp. NEB 688 TaxID=904039 RepID=UPI001563CD39|nr:UDP-N-acetylmuramate--L-alanine ligase [Arthrobacter sp. NEB 688]QKE84462.1 UDP-N-acetylmuramate--L-alanine ligase [Arthrobacter sp. NEB 688]